MTPKDSKSTLGKMISVMKGQKDWKLDLPTPDADVPVKMAEALVGMGLKTSKRGDLAPPLPKPYRGKLAAYSPNGAALTAR